MLGAPPNIKKETTPPLGFTLPFFPQIKHSNLKCALFKHWHLIINDSDFLPSLFLAPPLLAYKRQKNIKDQLIRARMQSSTEENTIKKMDAQNLQILLDLLQEQELGTQN